MTLKELYETIDGDYEQAIHVLKIEKLLDKHIRKVEGHNLVEKLVAAEATHDPAQIFDSAHAMKGVYANLGLTGLSAAAAKIADEFRPGNSRTMSDEQVAEKVHEIEEMFQKALEGIKAYTGT